MIKNDGTATAGTRIICRRTISANSPERRNHVIPVVDPHITLAASDDYALPAIIDVFAQLPLLAAADPKARNTIVPAELGKVRYIVAERPRTAGEIDVLEYRDSGAADIRGLLGTGVA